MSAVICFPSPACSTIKRLLRAATISRPCPPTRRGSADRGWGMAACHPGARAKASITPSGAGRRCSARAATGSPTGTGDRQVSVVRNVCRGRRPAPIAGPRPVAGGRSRPAPVTSRASRTSRAQRHARFAAERPDHRSPCPCVVGAASGTPELPGVRLRMSRDEHTDRGRAAAPTPRLGASAVGRSVKGRPPHSPRSGRPRTAASRNVRPGGHHVCRAAGALCSVTASYASRCRRYPVTGAACAP